MKKRPDGKYEFVLRRTLRDFIGLCPGEHFGEQYSVGTRCTGFLVTSRLGVTAGHCVSPLEVRDFCQNYDIVFDYRTDFEGQKPMILDASSIRECRSIVKLVYDPVGRDDDYAVLSLSASVADRAFGQFSRQFGKSGF